MPGMDTPQGQGLLAAAFSLMSAKGPSRINAIGQAGMAGLQGYGVAQDRQVKLAEEAQMQKLRGLQMQQAQMGADRENAFREAAKRNVVPAQAATPDYPLNIPTDNGPNLFSKNTSNMVGGGAPATPAGFNYEGYANDIAGADPMEAFRVRQMMQKDDAPIKLGAGEHLFSGKASGYKPLLSVPAKEAATPAAIQEYNFAKGQGYGGTFEQWDTSRKRAGASSTTVNMADGQKGFENEMKLGAGFKQEPIYKDHAAVQSAFSQINAALAQGTPISDTAAATKIMKILDPGSVVRESELGMAMAAGGRMDRLRNYLEQSMSGTKLTPQQRTDFGNLAAELTAASAQSYNSKRSEYHQQGKDYGLNADRALGKPVEVPTIMKPTTEKTADGKLSFSAPNGKTYVFNSERELANFKMATGAK